MRKLSRILLIIIAASLLFTLGSCKKKDEEVKLGENESYAFSEDGLYSFIYVYDDYLHVNFNGGESLFVIDDSTNVNVKSMVIAPDEPGYAGLDEFCETLPYYSKYVNFFKDFDFSNYTTVTLNKMENVRYYEKHMEAEAEDLTLHPYTVQIYIFRGENAYYVITAGYMDDKKDESAGKIKKLIDTFEERALEES